MHAVHLIARPQIAAGLRELGVESGDTVMVHASVGAVGWVLGGAQEAIGGLIDAVGASGTVMMYVGWEGSPYDLAVEARTLPQSLLDLWPAFDPATSHAVPSWSVLAEYLRTWPGAKRSGHPDSSFAAVGARADEMTRDHPLHYGMGPGSPLAKLCDVGGKVLLLGAPFSSVTLLHHAEHLADVPDKKVVHYQAPILRNGQKEWV